MTEKTKTIEASSGTAKKLVKRDRTAESKLAKGKQALRIGQLMKRPEYGQAGRRGHQDRPGHAAVYASLQCFARGSYNPQRGWETARL